MSGARCPYCFTDLDASEPVVTCTACRTPHHRACFLENGKCVTLACGSTRSRATDGSEVVRVALTVQLLPERHPFIPRGGRVWGEPRWLEVVRHAEARRAFTQRLAVTCQDSARPGEEIGGRIELQLTEPLQARGLRLVVRTQRTTAASVFPRTLVEREAVIVGFPWEGHQVAIGLAVRKLLGMTSENDLIWLPAGLTEWSFRFRLDPDWPQRDPDAAESVLTELQAYIDVPAAPDLEARTPLHILRGGAGSSR